MRADVVNGYVSDHIPPGSLDEQWDIEGLKARVKDVLGLDPPLTIVTPGCVVTGISRPHSAPIRSTSRRCARA
mgnify:CR=1 FL=1